MPPGGKSARAAAPLRLLRRAGLADEGEASNRDDVTGDTRWPRPQPVRPTSFELASAGYDPSLQVVGSDPNGDSCWAGLVVPTGAAAVTPNFSRRYLFMLAWMRLDPNRRGKIVGIRTSVRLGAMAPSTVQGIAYPVEHELQDPFWKGPGGNYCFYLQRIASPAQQLVYNIDDGPSLSYQYANGPALLYQSLSPYIPPASGMPPGVSLMPGGSWYDNRFGPWRNEDVWGGVDIAVQGPCDVALFISLQQMAQVKPVPAPGVLGLSPDDYFLQQNPTAQFARVAGSLIWQEVTAE
jgi:hypothetical protein